jgi:hyperosmotically inducible protein
MKILNRKYAGLVVLTALLGMPLAQAATANETVNEVQDVVSDSWITSKVKSVFLSDTSISGLDIKVETVDGVVALSGVVSTAAERDLAINKAKDIKGVKGVAADGLKTGR